MRRPIACGFAGGMQGKAHEGQPPHAFQRRAGLRLRGHASAERLAARVERYCRRALPRCPTAARTAAWATAGESTRLLPRSMYGNWKRSVAIAGREVAGKRRHERVLHAGARPVREHIGPASSGATSGLRRNSHPQSRDRRDRRSPDELHRVFVVVDVDSGFVPPGHRVSRHLQRGSCHQRGAPSCSAIAQASACIIDAGSSRRDPRGGSCAARCGRPSAQPHTQAPSARA